MLISKGMTFLLTPWQHSGFHVFWRDRIQPNDDTSVEDLAHCKIRASFSQERMRYLNQERRVVYTSKDKKTSQVFAAFG
jgi:hypothetical protein